MTDNTSLPNRKDLIVAGADPVIQPVSPQATEAAQQDQAAAAGAGTLATTGDQTSKVPSPEESTKNPPQSSETLAPATNVSSDSSQTQVSAEVQKPSEALAEFQNKSSPVTAVQEAETALKKDIEVAGAAAKSGISKLEGYVYKEFHALTSNIVGRLEPGKLKDDFQEIHDRFVKLLADHNIKL